MQKIPSLWLRDDQFRATDTHNPECEWVFVPEGDATVKWDGTAVLIENGRYFKRFRVRDGKPAPEGWRHWNCLNPATQGRGWLEVEPEDIPYLEAIAFWSETDGPEKEGDGTYELCGPTIRGNPHGFSRHLLVRHGNQVVAHVPLTFDGMRDYLELFQYEGLVYWHPDGRMAKVKKTDFGHPWPLQRDTDGEQRD